VQLVGNQQKVEAKDDVTNRAKELVDFVVRNCLDDDSNFVGISAPAQEDKMSDKIEILNGNSNYTLEHQMARNADVISEIQRRIGDEGTPVIEKLVLARLISDMREECDMEDDAELGQKMNEELNAFFDSENVPALISIYVANLGKRYTNAERSLKFHDPAFDKLHLSFSRKTLKGIFSNNPEEYNDTPIPGDYITAQLAPGVIGIYNKEGNLVAYKKITDDIADEMKTERRTLQEEIEAPMFKVNDPLQLKDRLPLKNPREDMAMFKIMESLPIREKIKEELDVDLGQFSLRVQYQFLEFARTKGRKEFEELKKFVNGASDDEARKNRIIAFLSLENGAEMGDKILSFDDWKDRESVNVLLSKYAEIVEASDNAGDYLRDKFGERSSYEEAGVQKIVDNMLRRGTNLLADYANNPNQSTANDVTDELEHYSADALLFSVAFKAISAKEKLRFEDVKDVEFSTVDSSVLDEKTKKELIRIFVANRVSTYDDALLAQVKKEFAEALEESGHKFHVLKSKGEIVAFLRLSELENGNLYLGSFNVRPEVRGVSIGGSFMSSIVEEEGRERDMELVVYEKNPILKTYVDKMGFQVVSKDSNYHGTGETFLKLVRPATEKKIMAVAA